MDIDTPRLSINACIDSSASGAPRAVCINCVWVFFFSCGMQFVGTRASICVRVLVRCSLRRRVHLAVLISEEFERVEGRFKNSITVGKRSTGHQWLPPGGGVLTFSEKRLKPPPTLRVTPIP